MPKGRQQARDTGLALVATYGLDPQSTSAAASDMLRSQQTAEVAGFREIISYAVLNEVNIPKTPKLKAILEACEIVPEARAAAEAVLTNPPAEQVWFTHGYLIAALCELTGADTSDRRFIPSFGEVRELSI